MAYEEQDAKLVDAMEAAVADATEEGLQWTFYDAKALYVGFSTEKVNPNGLLVSLVTDQQRYFTVPWPEWAYILAKEAMLNDKLLRIGVIWDSSVTDDTPDEDKLSGVYILNQSPSF